MCDEELSSDQVAGFPFCDKLLACQPAVTHREAAAVQVNGQNVTGADYFKQLEGINILSKACWVKFSMRFSLLQHNIKALRHLIENERVRCFTAIHCKRFGTI